MGSENITLYGADYIIEKIGDIKYELSAKSFFQLNPLATKKLYDKVVEFANLNETDVVLDAFCGVGTIGQYVSSKCKEVYGVDIVEDAINNIAATDFRLLTEYHSFLFNDFGNMNMMEILKFPSPYGVLFILIFFFKISIDLETIPVSVSLWSIIHSYFKLVKNGAFGG